MTNKEKLLKIEIKLLKEKIKLNLFNLKEKKININECINNLQWDFNYSINILTNIKKSVI